MSRCIWVELCVNVRHAAPQLHWHKGVQYMIINKCCQWKWLIPYKTPHHVSMDVFHCWLLVNLEFCQQQKVVQYTSGTQRGILLLLIEVFTGLINMVFITQRKTPAGRGNSWRHICLPFLAPAQIHLALYDLI